MYTHLEDEFGDIIGKARRGQEIDPARLAGEVGLTAEQILRIERYESIPTPAVIQRLAQSLDLHPDKLGEAAGKGFFPSCPAGRRVEGLSVEMMILGTDFQVNGYLVGCPETGKGMVIDPGMDAGKILTTIQESGLEIERIVLTHGHADHVGALSEICRATGAPAAIGQDEPALQIRIEERLVDGQPLILGRQRLAVRSFPGHTPGAIGLLHERLVFVGDVLFAGSLGGTRTRHNYQQQRQAVVRHILTLDDAVLLYPGHGPATTVGEERRHNPFFHGKSQAAPSK